MEINNEIIIAYSQCAYKAFLLIENNSNKVTHKLVQFYDERKAISHEKYFNSFKESKSNISLNKTILYKYNTIRNPDLKFNNLKATCPLIVNSSGKNEITIFSDTNKVTSVHKIELLFISYVLSKKDIEVNIGNVLTPDLKKHSQKIYDFSKIINLVNKINSLSGKPMLILNRACCLCEFHQYCLKTAKEEDNLSLLAHISTENQIKKFEKKGIFTVKQLSYTYKPRRIKHRFSQVLKMS